MKITLCRKSAFTVAAVLLTLSILSIWVAVNIQSDISHKFSNLTFSNVTANAVTVSWTSTESYVGQVYAGTRGAEWGRVPNILLTQVLVGQDDRDVLSNPRARYTHHVTVSGLLPETEYSFAIKGKVVPIGLKNQYIKTKQLEDKLLTPEPGYGKITGLDGEDAIVLVGSDLDNSEDNNLVSTPVAANGTYSVDLGRLSSVPVEHLYAIVRTAGQTSYQHSYLSSLSKPFETISLPKEPPLSQLMGLTDHVLASSGQSCLTTGSMNLRNTPDGEVFKGIESGVNFELSLVKQPVGSYEWSQIVSANDSSYVGKWVARTSRLSCGASAGLSCTTTRPMNVRNSANGDLFKGISNGVSLVLSSQVTSNGGYNWAPILDSGDQSLVGKWIAKTQYLSCGSSSSGSDETPQSGNESDSNNQSGGSISDATETSILKTNLLDIVNQTRNLPNKFRSNSCDGFEVEEIKASAIYLDTNRLVDTLDYKSFKLGLEWESAQGGNLATNDPRSQNTALEKWAAENLDVIKPISANKAGNHDIAFIMTGKPKTAFRNCINSLTADNPQLETNQTAFSCGILGDPIVLRSTVNANIRLAAKVASSTVGSLKTGDTITGCKLLVDSTTQSQFGQSVDSNYPSWYRVSYQGEIGYIYSPLMTPTDLPVGIPTGGSGDNETVVGSDLADSENSQTNITGLDNQAKIIVLGFNKTHGTSYSNLDPIYEYYASIRNTASLLSDTVYQELLIFDAWKNISGDYGDINFTQDCKNANVNESDFMCMLSIAYLTEFQVFLGNNFSFNQATGKVTSGFDPAYVYQGAHFFITTSKIAYGLQNINSAYYRRYSDIPEVKKLLFNADGSLTGEGNRKVFLLALEHSEGYKALGYKLVNQQTKSSYVTRLKNFFSGSDRTVSLLRMLSVMWNSKKMSSFDINSDLSISRGFFTYRPDDPRYAAPKAMLQTGEYYSGDVVTACELGNDITVFVGSSRIKEPLAERHRKIRQYYESILSSNRAASGVISLPSTGGSATGSRILSTVSAAASDEDTKYYDTNINESGRYLFETSEGAIEKNVIFNGESPKIVFFKDDNANGIMDLNETTIDNPMELKITKKEDAVGYSLEIGWNLIHIPLAKSGKDSFMASTLARSFNQQGAMVRQVARYVHGAFQIYTTRDLSSIGASDFPLIPGDAYFVYSANYAAQVTLSGTGVASSQPPLNNLEKGWNLKGVISEQPLSSSDILSSSTLKLDTISRYKSGQYYSQIKDIQTGEIYGNGYKLTSTEGYFVKVF